MVRHHSKSQSGLNLQNSFFENMFMGNTIISNAKRAEKKPKPMQKNNQIEPGNKFQKTRTFRTPNKNKKVIDKVHFGR